MIYITGDTHGNFKRIARFCQQVGTTEEDILIILGDAGFNFHGGDHDRYKKAAVSQLPITVFSIHGNHEMRPATIPSYTLRPWHGGQVYVEEEFPNLLFAMDGEVYDLGGAKTVVMGGAYSIDKEFRLARNFGWWPDEQPSDEIKARVETKLDSLGWQVDGVLSHTTPLKYEPFESFLPGFDQSKIDNSTEVWLDSIEDRLNYKHWYCGHFHINKDTDRLTVLFEEFREFSV